MLTKPLIFALTFLMTIVNFIILLVPVAFFAFPVFMFLESLFEKVGMNLLFFLISRISFLMIVYLILDFIFGFTVRRANRGAVPFNKTVSLYANEEIAEAFEWLKRKFNMPAVKLYISPSFREINAYAIGSMRKKQITITMGLLEEIKTRSANKTQYVDAVKGILGHEMSHLSNKDYLPGLLAYANESVTKYISTLFHWGFYVFSAFFRIIPIIGRPLYRFIMSVYKLLNFIINLFFKRLFMPIYNFLQKWLGRSVEYRCDKESSHALSGHRMALALSMIGEGSYFSIFSTHPRTKFRINYIKDIRPRPGTIKPGIMNRLANLVSVLLVIFVCWYSTDKTEVPEMYQHYLTEVHYPIIIKTQKYKKTIIDLYSNVIGKRY